MCPRSCPTICVIFLPQGSLKQLSYLMDVHTFSPKDVALNQTTLTWPSKLSPIFEENERVCDGLGGVIECDRTTCMPVILNLPTLYPLESVVLPYYQLTMPHPLIIDAHATPLDR